MWIDLITEYSSFLADHIERFSTPGKGCTSYLSLSTDNGKSMSAKIEAICSDFFLL